MKKISSILWGVALVAVGLIFALNALEITDIDVFFDGWWTLFIIVPAAVGLFTESDKTGNLIALAVGAVLLLAANGVFDYDLLWKLLIPAIIVFFGLKMILSGILGNKASAIMKKKREEGKKPYARYAVFSGCEERPEGEGFEGANLTAVFGGIDLDLRGAVIEKDTAIVATAVFGGIDILVPENVNVQVQSNGIFGGTENKTKANPGAPTLYISSVCVFGGVEVR